MKSNIWYPKQKPISTLASLSGGAGGMMYGGGVDQDYSVNFDGSNDRVSIPDTTDFEFADGDFTVEAWIKQSNAAGSGATSHTIVNKWHNTSNAKEWILRIDNGTGSNKFEFIHTTNGSSNIITTGNTIISTNTWYHVAAVGHAGTIKLFVNGIQQSSTGSQGTINAYSNPLYFGYNLSSNSQWMDGKISNCRITKGQALYTSAFTPTTEALTTTSQSATASNVKLLCLNQSTVTGSTKTPGTITNEGATASTDNPFPSNAAYSTDFDGSGDYLSIADNNAWYIDTNYTAECWFYCDALTGAGWDAIFGQWQSNGANATNGWVLEYVGTNLDFYYMTSGGSYSYKTIGTPALQTWHHFAISKSGSTTRLFLNGSEGVSSFDMGAQQNGTGVFTVGGYVASAGYFNGRVSNVRITKDQALYTSAFTPSTEPLTTTSQGATASNVKLLCCNTSTTTGSTVTPSTITANGNAVVSSLNPF